jgi:hypothetical protein
MESLSRNRLARLKKKKNCIPVQALANIARRVQVGRRRDPAFMRLLEVPRYGTNTPETFTRNCMPGF